MRGVAGRCVEGGMTIVELMAVVVLFLTLTAALLTAFLTARTSYHAAEASVQVQQELRRAFDAAVQELREAGNVDLSGDAKQLHYQINRDYDVAGECDDTVCWGSEQATGEWVHLVITGTTGDDQLLRCVTDDAVDPVTEFDTGCRVLANRVRGDTSAFNYAGGIATLTLQCQRRDPVMPGGTEDSGGGVQETKLLTAQVRLRNP